MFAENEMALNYVKNIESTHIKYFTLAQHLLKDDALNWISSCLNLTITPTAVNLSLLLNLFLLTCSYYNEPVPISLNLFQWTCHSCTERSIFQWIYPCCGSPITTSVDLSLLPVAVIISL